MKRFELKIGINCWKTSILVSSGIWKVIVSFPAGYSQNSNINEYSEGQTVKYQCIQI